MMNEGAGLTVRDLTPYKRHGTLSGSTIPVWVRTQDGIALEFNGAESNPGYVSLPNSFTGYTEFTILQVVRSDIASGTSNVKQTFNNGDMFGFSWNHTNSTFQKAWFHQDNGSAYTVAQYTSTLSAATRYVIVCTWGSHAGGSKRLRAFLNGVREADVAEIGTIATGSGNVTLGSTTPTLRGFDGRISLTLLYNKVKTDEQVKFLSRYPYMAFLPAWKQFPSVIGGEVGTPPSGRIMGALVGEGGLAGVGGLAGRRGGLAS